MLVNHCSSKLIVCLGSSRLFLFDLLGNDSSREIEVPLREQSCRSYLCSILDLDGVELEKNETLSNLSIRPNLCVRNTRITRL